MKKTSGKKPSAALPNDLLNQNLGGGEMGMCNNIKNSSSRPEFTKDLMVFTILLVFSFLIVSVGISSRVVLAKKNVPNEREIEKVVNGLSFLSSSEKQTFVESLQKGAQKGLLDFSSSVGTRTLLEALASQDWTDAAKADFIDIYRNTLKKNLPLFLITKTSIRLLRRGAPFSALKSTVTGEISLLVRIRDYVKEKGVPLYVTFRNEAMLIDTLAESVRIYLRRQNSTENASSAQALDQLKQTSYNILKFSSLPVSVGTESGSKGASAGDDVNPQLNNFLRKEETISELAKLADTFKDR